MSYEIDFISVGSEAKQDADAFCFRWADGYGKDGNPLYKIGVFDGGFEPHGNGYVTPNDIEMMLEAWKTNSWQAFVDDDPAAPKSPVIRSK